MQPGLGAGQPCPAAVLVLKPGLLVLNGLLVLLKPGLLVHVFALAYHLWRGVGYAAHRYQRGRDGQGCQRNSVSVRADKRRTNTRGGRVYAGTDRIYTINKGELDNFIKHFKEETKPLHDAVWLARRGVLGQSAAERVHLGPYL